MPSILWSRPGDTLVRSTLGTIQDGYRLAGTVLTSRDGVPLEIRYVIMTDPIWRPRNLGIHVLGSDPDARLALAGDGDGAWTLDGEKVPGLAGCIDLDLGFTPATLTLIVRRLGLANGESAEVRAASIGFPGEPVEAAGFTMTRTGADTFRLAGPDGEGDLRLNPDGFAVSYADWQSVAVG